MKKADIKKLKYRSRCNAVLLVLNEKYIHSIKSELFSEMVCFVHRLKQA